jgi:hypothetical protein
VLSQAGLVTGQRQGREVRYEVRTSPLAATADWLTGLAAEWDRRLAAIKRIAGSGSASPGGATPWNPRWPEAPFLRHRALALLA